MYYDRWKPYVPVAKRRAQAARKAAKLAKKGQTLSPVVIDGRAIAKTFWGKAWCDNLERYSDYSNRLPRGRTYARNGSVIDLQVAPGAVTALVSGSEIYQIEVKVTAVPNALWSAVCKDCAGRHRLARRVVAGAVLYGIGARLDEKPDLLFALRKVDHQDLIAKAGKGLPRTKKGPAPGKVLDTGDLSDIFGIEMAQEAEPQTKVLARSGAHPKNTSVARPNKATKPSKQTTPVNKRSLRRPR
ncbi:MAG: hypothetical protein HYU27_07550 [Acidobacteria bacterium]|nr:hypothetical protein [Acidobacteriota bacterium]